MTEEQRMQRTAAGCFLCLFIGLASGAGVGAVAEMNDINAIYRQAAEHNAGRWEVDPRTGKTAWVWTGR